MTTQDQLEDEITRLRIELAEVKKELSDTKTRFDEFDLREGALKGAKQYCDKWCKGMPMEERNKFFNVAAHNIIAGFRKREQMWGIASGDPWLGIFEAAAGSQFSLSLEEIKKARGE